MKNVIEEKMEVSYLMRPTAAFYTSSIVAKTTFTRYVLRNR